MSDDQIITWVYRAASGLEAWPMILDRTAEIFNGIGIHILGIDKLSGQIVIDLHTSNASATVLAHSDRATGSEESRLIYGGDVAIGQVISNRGNNGHELTGTAFYRNCLMPNGYSHIIAGKLCDDDALLILMGIGRGSQHGAFGVQEERRLGRLLPHFANAMDMMRGTREWHVRSNVGEALLGRSMRPSFLLGPGARLEFANGAGYDALKRARVVVNRLGALAARDVQANAKLKCALCALGMLDADVAATCPDRIPLWLHDIDSGKHIPACLWAIRANPVLGSFSAKSMGLLILTTADRPRHVIPDPVVLASMFGFTPAEARVAAHLIGGAAPKEIATTLKLGVPTVRYHLRQLLAKCCSRDQRQLVGCLSEALEVNGL